MNKEMGKLIETRLNELASNTMVNGEIWRSSYTLQDRISKDLFRRWAKEADLDCREDTIGNVYARLPGKRSEVILVGSHLDTVKDGGKYDGALGVITGLTVLQNLKSENFTPEYTIEVAGLMEEEGGRYSSSCHGSRGITGQLQRTDLEEPDSLGISFAQAMKLAGYDPESYEQAKRSDIKAYLELHIEQGPVLELARKQIGIVENIVGIVNYDLSIFGEQNHAGTTLMNMRKDPVTAAADLISGISKKISNESIGTVITFGRINAHPGMQNVIASQVDLSVDLRDKSEQTLRFYEKHLLDQLQNLKTEGFTINAARSQWTAPTKMDDKLINILEQAIDAERFSSMRLNSGAGHDAMLFADRIPTAMIFVPSRGGISHNPLEYTALEDLQAGAAVLCRMLKDMQTTRKWDRTQSL